MKKIMAFFGLFLALFAFLCVPVFASSSFDFPVVLPQNTQYYYVCEVEDNPIVKDVENCKYVVYCSSDKLISQYDGTQFLESWMNGEDYQMPVYVYGFENIDDVKNWLVSFSSITPIYTETRKNAYIEKITYTNHGDQLQWGNSYKDVSDKDYNPGSIVDMENLQPLFSEIIGLLPVLLGVLVGFIGIRKAISFLSGVMRSA